MPYHDHYQVPFSSNAQLDLVALIYSVLPYMSVNSLRAPGVQNSTTGAPSEHIYHFLLFTLLDWALAGEGLYVYPEVREHT